MEEGKGGPVVKTDAMHMGRRLRLRVYRTWVTRPPRSRAPPSSGAPSVPLRAPGRHAPPAAPLASPVVPLPRSPRQTMLRTLLLAEPPLLAEVGRGAALGSGLGGRAASRRPLQAEGARGGVAGRPAPDAAGPEGSSPRSEQASADLAPRSVRCARGARAVRPARAHAVKQRPDATPGRCLAPTSTLLCVKGACAFDSMRLMEAAKLQARQHTGQPCKLVTLAQVWCANT